MFWADIEPLIEIYVKLPNKSWKCTTGNQQSFKEVEKLGGCNDTDNTLICFWVKWVFLQRSDSHEHFFCIAWQGIGAATSCFICHLRHTEANQSPVIAMDITFICPPFCSVCWGALCDCRVYSYIQTNYIIKDVITIKSLLFTSDLVHQRTGDIFRMCLWKAHVFMDGRQWGHMRHLKASWAFRLSV